MDPQQQKDHNLHLEDMMNGGNVCGKISTSSYHGRQSSTRWTPTTEQIKLLKELYYINGLRSPTADQIHTICARLRCYGKVEGKNVFYWFQNHKARERQKKRLTPNSSSNATISAPQYHNNTIIRKRGLDWKQNQDLTVHNKHIAINNSGVSSSTSSAAVVSDGVHLVGNFMYGAVTTGNKVRESSMSGGGFPNGGSANHDLEWAAVDYTKPTVPVSYSHFLDKVSANDEDDVQDHYKASDIETLPLFPMHSEEHHDYDHDHDQNHHHLVPAGFCAMKTGSDGYYTGGCWWVHGSRGSASLELSLKSYGYGHYPPKL